MNDKLLVLLNWVEETIHPQKLANCPLTDAYILSLKEDIFAEVKTLKKTFFKQLVFSKKQAASGMIQLVKISDIVHKYLYRLTPVWNHSILAQTIRSLYIYILNFLETALKEIGNLAPKIYRQIPVTMYGLSDLKIELKGHYTTFLRQSNRMDIDHDLKILVQKGLYQFIHKKAITRFNADYYNHLIATISNGSDNLNTQIFMELLCLKGFNLPEFYLYRINEYKKTLENIPGLHEQLVFLMTEKDKLNGLTIQKEIKMLPDVPQIVEQLQGFLREKEHYIRQMLKLRRVIIQDDQLVKSMTRLKTNLSVAQFALFIRLQIEKGILLKENIGDQFSFFATHFYTSQTMFISADSLRKKSTEVEFNTAQKLKAYLISMLNWLNENYNLSNFKDS